MASKPNRVTTNDIASLAGVSQSTVSLVLNRKVNSGISAETERRVLEAATKLGYLQPTESPAGNTMKRDFAVLVPDMVAPYTAGLLSHFSRRAYENQLQMLACNTYQNMDIEKEYLTRLHTQGIGGILYIGAPICIDLIEKVNTTIPVVVVGETFQDMKVPMFIVDNMASGHFIAQHVYDLGHRNIAYITPPINAFTLIRQQRLDGVRGFFREKGVEETFYVYEQTSHLACDDESFDVVLGRLQAEKALSEHKDITAIIASGDLIAIGAYQALRAAGLRVPEDVSVVGYGNIEFGRYLSPPLTTVDTKVAMRGKSGFDYLLKLMSGSAGEETDPLFVSYRPSVIVRESTRKV